MPHSTSLGSGPRVVFVHGSMTTSRKTWKRQENFADRWTVILVDRRGYAPNPRAERSDFEVDGSDLASFLDTDAHLVGHSYGALAVLLAAAHRPEAVRSLTVIEAPVACLARGDAKVEERIKIARESTLLDDPVEIYRRFLTRMGAPTDAVPNPLPEDIERQVRLMINERPPWEAHLPIDVLARSRFPKLIVSGGWDPVFEIANDALAAQLGTSAQRLVLPGGGHVVQRREAFNPVLEDFLSAAEHGQ